MEKSYVQSAEYCVLPQNDLFIEMSIVAEGNAYTCIIRDPKNWIYDHEGRVSKAKPPVSVDMNELYKVKEEIIHLNTGEKRTLVPIEQEMALDYLLMQCGEEIVRVKKEQEEKMIRLLGMNDAEFSSLSEEEMEHLSAPYEYSGNKL